MQFLCFFLSVFCGILGGVAAVRLIYSAMIEKISDIYRKRKQKEKWRIKNS